MHTSPQRWLVSSARLWASILLTCAAVGALPPAPVRAATITVTNTNDSAGGSLRQALEDADDGDTIVFAISGEIHANTPLQVTKDLTIQGPITLSGYWDSPQKWGRVLEIAEDAEVTLAGITVQMGQHAVEGGGILNHGTLVLDGCSLYSNGAGERGGAVANHGSLTTLNGTFQSNSAANGAAIYNAPGATLSITGDGVVATREFHSNNATGNGGSIYNSGTMLMTGAHFYSGGSTGGHGGAIYNTGVATITSSQFEMVVASAGNGGAIANTGTLTMHGGKLFHKQSSNGADVGGTIWNAAGGTFTATETEWSNTHARVRGGALATDGTATLTDCVLRGGTAPYAGGIHVGATGSLTVSSGLMSGYEATAGSGGAIYTEGTLHVFDSTIASNSALLDGGGIYIGGTQASEIRRTTLQQNSAVGGGGGISAAGRLVLENSTLFQNRAGLGGGLLVSGACSSATVTNTTIAYSGYGGSSTADGQGISAYGPLSLANSIVAYSTGGTDCYAPTATTNGRNLVEDGSCGNLSGDPLLATLQWNGGDTQTLALMPGSPAVDAGATSGCPATDQRGMSRPQGTGCDLGAFEAGPPFGLPSGAQTDAATSVGPTGATLNGLVFHLYWPTDVTFSYGLAEAYGATVPAAQSPIPTDPTDWENYEQVSVPISGLEPNRTYHFRVEGENAFGAAYGEDLTFRTVAIAPSVTTGAADGLTGAGATLHGTVNAHNSDATVLFEYGLTDAYGETLAAAPALATGNANTPVLAALAGLDPNTEYYYRVRATNAVSTTHGADGAFTTSKVPPTVTTDPESGVTASGATLHGTVNARNADTTVTFEYGTTAGYGTTAAGTPGVATE
ncbi:MAG: hypothetical protein GX649_15025, partial [Chloroflexi bacterium]|nr:hypothetical protein [Chloroflexota bacterium]